MLSQTFLTKLRLSGALSDQNFLGLVFRYLTKTVTEKTKRNNGKITVTGNSGAEGVGVLEAGIGEALEKANWVIAGSFCGSYISVAFN